MVMGPKRSGRSDAATAHGRASGKQTHAAKASEAKRPKAPAPAKKPVEKAAVKPARGRAQVPRQASAGRGGRRDPIVAAQLEAIAHRVEQIGGLRADLEELRTQVGTIAQSLATLAQTVETLFASPRRSERAKRTVTPAIRDRSKGEEGGAKDRASVTSDDAEPEAMDPARD